MDVLPNPATRVPLIALPNDPASSYINANFVRSYDGTPNRFICTQGPLPDTVVAFWRMVLEHGVDCIVMATGLEEKGEKKCEAYFPRTPSTPPLTFGGLAVACLAHTPGPAFDQALLEVSFAVRQRSGATSRRTHVVKHVWYHAWPDHGVPRTPTWCPTRRTSWTCCRWWRHTGLTAFPAATWRCATACFFLVHFASAPPQ